MNLRILQIIKLLIDANKVLIIKDISEKLNVSNKTIRNDLKIAEKMLLENDLKLIKKTGVGIYIEGDEKAKLKMLSNIKNQKTFDSQYSSRDRQLYILSKLFSNTKEITTTTSLQNELFISRPSVYKDLEKVNEWVSERDIKLEYTRKNGILLKAGEKRIRKAIMDLFLLSEEYDEIFDMIERFNNSNNANYASINFFSYSQKEDILGIDYHKVNKIILKLEDCFHVKFTSTDLTRLTIMYAIAISRMLEGKFVEMKDKTLKNLQELNKYEKMVEVVKEIQKEFKLNIPREEIGYLFGITIVCKTHFEEKDWNINEEMLVINKIVAKEIIELTKDAYNIYDENTFYNGLVHHLKSVTNKIKYNLDFYNPIMNEIRKNYSDAFQIASKSKSIFEEYYNYSIPMDEMGFIALHIAAAIERSKKPLSAYVIYHSSYSEVKLMIEILKNNFNQFEAKKIIPLSMFEEVKDEDIDLIITTKKIEGFDGDEIVLPTILKQEHLQKFSKIVKDVYERENYKRLKKVP